MLDSIGPILDLCVSILLIIEIARNIRLSKRFTNIKSLLSILKQKHPECEKDIDEIFDYMER